MKPLFWLDQPVVSRTFHVGRICETPQMAVCCQKMEGALKKPTVSKLMYLCFFIYVLINVPRCDEGARWRFLPEQHKLF